MNEWIRKLNSRLLLQDHLLRVRCVVAVDRCGSVPFIFHEAVSLTLVQTLS